MDTTPCTVVTLFPKQAGQPTPCEPTVTKEALPAPPVPSLLLSEGDKEYRARFALGDLCMLEIASTVRVLGAVSGVHFVPGRVTYDVITADDFRAHGVESAAVRKVSPKEAKDLKVSDLHFLRSQMALLSANG